MKDNNQIKVVFDPLEHYIPVFKAKDIPVARGLDSLELACGYIPKFLINPAQRDVDAWTALDRQYQHGGGMREFEGFDFQEGVMNYPGDPELFPYMLIIRGEESIYIYPGSWVTVVDSKDRVRTARVD